MATKKSRATGVVKPAAAPASETKTGVAALDGIFESVNRSDAPGLVVAVAQHGKVLYRRSFGLASIEHGVVNTPVTRMRLASITKHFASLAALLLAEDGKLDLDAPASRVLPELKPLEGMPTLRQFMHHTSGYRCFMELGYISGVREVGKGWGLAMQFRQTGVNFAPGQSQLYNNGGYELLSEAIARASGQSFEAFLKERLFQPLGMRDTESVPNDMLITPGIATFHVPLPQGGWRRGITPIEDNRGAGAIVTTVDDMLRWMANLRGPVHTVGSDDTWRQMTTTAVLDNGLKTTYALGLNRHFYRGIEVLHHGGSLAGVGSQMLTVPAHGLDVIVMTNGALVNPVQMAWQVVDALLAEHLSGEAAPLVEAAPYKHLFGARYHAPSGMLYGFGDAGGKLGLTFLHSPPLPILRERGEFIGFLMEEAGLGPLEIRLADLAPGADGGAPDALEIRMTGTAERFTRLPDSLPDTRKVGQALTGRYRCEDVDADVTVAFEGEHLVLKIVAPGGHRAFALQALSDVVFGMTAQDPLMPGFHALTVERKSRRVTGLRVSSGRARKLAFARLPD
jgi:D-aminopeptidase